MIVFKSVEEAVDKLRLDKRRKWSSFEGSLIYTTRVLIRCAGCSGSGCRECGMRGECRIPVPIPARWPDGSYVKVSTTDAR